jgi:hypothetical protein
VNPRLSFSDVTTVDGFVCIFEAVMEYKFTEAKHTLAFCGLQMLKQLKPNWRKQAHLRISRITF